VVRLPPHNSLIFAAGPWHEHGRGVSALTSDGHWGSFLSLAKLTAMHMSVLPVGTHRRASIHARVGLWLMGTLNHFSDTSVKWVQHSHIVRELALVLFTNTCQALLPQLHGNAIIRECALFLCLLANGVSSSAYLSVFLYWKLVLPTLGQTLHAAICSTVTTAVWLLPV
jgi:hypothetical protein